MVDKLGLSFGLLISFFFLASSWFWLFLCGFTANSLFFVNAPLCMVVLWWPSLLSCR